MYIPKNPYKTPYKSNKKHKKTDSDISTHEKAKLLLATAIHSTLDNEHTLYYEYPIVPEYYGKINNNVLDYADVILQDNPYNNSNIPLDITTLSDTDTNDYITHLKSIPKMCRNQHEFNTDWIPSASSTFPKGLRASAIVDIVITNESSIIEMWLITTYLASITDRVNSIISLGYNIPIYYIHPSWINDHSNISYSELYKQAKEAASQLNPNLTMTNKLILKNPKSKSTTESVPHKRESDLHKDSKLILAKAIKDTNRIPYIEYPILSTYGIMPLHEMITDFAPNILKFSPYNESSIMPDIHKLSSEELDTYKQHLLSYGKSEQYGLHDHWVPNKFIQQRYLSVIKAIADIAINDDNLISELWEIKHTNPMTNEKLEKLKACGYSHIPIYEINAAWLLENNDADNLYELAKIHAVRWN
jgi:hypothetical protein